MHVSNLLPLDRIVIDDEHVAGFRIRCYHRPSRVPGEPFRRTQPAHVAICTRSYGTHPAVPQTYTWIARFCFQKKLERPLFYKQASLETIILPSDCTIQQATLQCGEGINPRTALPLHGIWLFVQFSQPGKEHVLVHPRPLVEIPYNPTPP